MEPSELDHHHQQRREHLRGFAAAAAPPATPSTPPHHVGLSNHAWKYSSLLLKDEEYSTTPISGGGAEHHLESPSIDPKEGYEALLPPPPLGSTSMVHDQLGLQYYWPCTKTTADTFQLEQLACRAAEEFPDSFLKLAGAARFGAAVWNPAAAGEHYHSPSTGKYVVPSPDADVVGLPSHTSDDHMYFQLPTSTSSSCAFGGGAAATAFERVGSYTKLLLAAPNSSTPPSSSLPGSFSMPELQALELLASARLGAQQMTLRQPSLIGNVAFFGEGVACGSTTGFLPAAPSHQGESATNEPQIKISSLLDGVKEGKRANGGHRGQYKASPAPAAKKARPAAAEPRSSTSPLKVRKEKLGDRVAALQQLVAPFGKTDTASVLTEAVGYIKFLQEQVQTLSMPYLRSSNKKKIRTAQGINPNYNEEKDETKQDLRSRGLCLVPLSYTSYFTSESTGSSTAWSPSYFRGA